MNFNLLTPKGQKSKLNSQSSPFPDLSSNSAVKTIVFPSMKLLKFFIFETPAKRNLGKAERNFSWSFEEHPPGFWYSPLTFRVTGDTFGNSSFIPQKSDKVTFHLLPLPLSYSILSLLALTGQTCYCPSQNYRDNKLEWAMKCIKVSLIVFHPKYKPFITYTAEVYILQMEQFFPPNFFSLTRQ